MPPLSSNERGLGIAPRQRRSRLAHRLGPVLDRFAGTILAVGGPSGTTRTGAGLVCELPLEAIVQEEEGAIGRATLRVGVHCVGLPLGVIGDGCQGVEADRSLDLVASAFDQLDRAAEEGSRCARSGRSRALRPTAAASKPGRATRHRESPVGPWLRAAVRRVRQSRDVPATYRRLRSVRTAGLQRGISLATELESGPTRIRMLASSSSMCAVAVARVASPIRHEPTGSKSRRSRVPKNVRGDRFAD